MSGFLADITQSGSAFDTLVRSMLMGGRHSNAEKQSLDMAFELMEMNIYERIKGKLVRTVEQPAHVARERKSKSRYIASLDDANSDLA